MLLHLPPMPLSIRQFSRLAVAVSAAVMLPACSNNVTIPPAGTSDQPPTITVSGEIVGNTGTLGQSVITSTAKVHVSSGTRIQLFVGAKNHFDNNEGGVKQLQLTVMQGTASLFNLTVTGAANLMGGVPDALAIIGTSATPSQPITFTMNSSDVVATVTATNFHDQMRTVVVTYSATCGCNPLTETADASCNCTPITCPPPQQMSINGCCPLGSVSCNGVCLPQGWQCCSNTGVQPGYHCCSDPAGFSCPFGSSCCTATECCVSPSTCQDGECILQLSLQDPLQRDIRRMSKGKSVKAVKIRK